MNDVKELLGFGRSKIKVLKVEQVIENNVVIQKITLVGTVKKVRCPICNKYTSSVHDTLKPANLKFSKIAEQNCIISVIKRRFICHNCKKRIIEDIGINSKKKTVSNRLEIKIRKDLLKPNFNIKQIALDNNVSHNCVRSILKDAMTNYPNHLRTLPEVISFDEFKADTSYGKYAFILNDPIKKKALDVLPCRKKEYLNNYFTKVENRNNVKYVISDMYEPYLLVTKIMFPKAKYVVDRFHYVTYIMDALDDIRIRLQKEFGYNSKQYKILKNKKNVTLLRIRYGDERIKWYVYTKRYERGRYVYKLPRTILDEMLAINDELKRGYDLKELFLDIINNSDYKNAEKDLLVWIDLCNQSKITEFIEASKTINNWLPYIVNSFIDKRFTNGFTEGLNNKIKVIKRNAYGYKNFTFFRLRLLYILNGKLSGRSKKNDK